MGAGTCGVDLNRPFATTNERGVNCPLTRLTGMRFLLGALVLPLPSVSLKSASAAPVFNMVKLSMPLVAVGGTRFNVGFEQGRIGRWIRFNIDTGRVEPQVEVLNCRGVVVNGHTSHCLVT